MANVFRVGDVVHQRGALKVDGIIKHIACYGATGAGGRTCDKKICMHSAPEYIWVSWPGVAGLFSYHHSELELGKPVAGANTASSSTPQPTDAPKELPKLSDKDFAALDAFTKKVAKKAATQFEQRTLQNDEIDFDRYNGFVKQPRGEYNYRKGG